MFGKAINKSMHRQPSIYSKLYVKYSRRAKFTPRVARPYRPRVIAWHGPDAFFQNRFYELDSWYKARIQRPEILPQLHTIDPDSFQESYEQKMIHRKNRSLNIGFKKKEKEWKTTIEERAKMEAMAIENKLLIDLDRVDSTNQLALSEHFNIFEDIFLPGVYFENTQPFDVFWSAQTAAEEHQSASLSYDENVYFGNVIKARMTTNMPSVKIGKIGSGAFNTLLMLNLEGPGQCEEGEEPAHSPFEEATTERPGKPPHRVPDSEDELLSKLERCQLMHWMVANIPDSGGLDEGEQLVPYIQPTPFFGSGYHRFVFLLLRHRRPLDFSAYKLKSGNSLLSRAFNMNSFYKKYEDQMTPSSLRFCQIKWDENCDRALHSLGLKSPKYWYDWNEQLKPEQKEFPKKPMPFNHYLDMFRNPATVRKEVQRKRLEMLVKLKPGEKALEPQKYPDIFYRENRRKLPEFVHEQIMKQNMGQGIYSALYHVYENPAEQHEMEKWKPEVKETEEIQNCIFNFTPTTPEKRLNKEKGKKKKRK